MSRITETQVSIQTSPQPVPSLPSWFGEVVLVVTYLKKQGVLTKLYEQVRFARKRFGQYEQGFSQRRKRAHLN